MSTVRSHVDDGGVVEWCSGQPAPALGGYVLGYTGYREDLRHCVHRRETPSGRVTLIVSFGDVLRVGAAASKVVSFVAGLHEGPVLTAHDGRQGGVQVSLDPLGAYALFGRPLHELSNAVVSLDDVAGREAGSWGERLGELRSWEARYVLLDQLLIARLRDSVTEPCAAVRSAWGELRQAHGAAGIAGVAARTGRSHRWLVEKFKEQVGVAPKTAARLLRYQRAAAMAAPGIIPLATVAAVCGYADQAHMNREFLVLAGCTPRALIRDRPQDGYQSAGSVLSKT